MTEAQKLVYRFEDLQELGIPLSLPQARRLMRDGKFPPQLYIGNKAVWLARAVHEWLDERVAAAPAERAQMQAWTVDARGRAVAKTKGKPRPVKS
jgi:predicted DNA-binding transcriptional regulator AlpA